MARILVVGSANVDQLVAVDRHPAAGQTVVGRLIRSNIVKVPSSARTASIGFQLVSTPRTAGRGPRDRAVPRRQYDRLLV
jgi:hypothetical protein